PVLSASSAGSMTLTIFGARGSGLVARMYMRGERRPGTTRYRRSTWGCGAFGHKHDEQAFQPKWWNSSPTSVAATLPMILEYDDDFGSTSTTAMRSGDFRSGSKAAT